MTQEDKDLLLKDLCGRLPYGVKVNNEIQGKFTVYGICENFIYGRSEVCHIDFAVEKIKPYLFPMSSMTEEQKKELIELINIGQNDNNEFMRSLCSIEFYHKNHIDYRGLIKKGLANDATGLNIY